MIDATATISAEAADVTARNRRTSMASAPPLPSKVTTAKGATKPACTCAAEMGKGYVGKEGLLMRTRHASPIVVAKAKGMANQALPLVTT